MSNKLIDLISTIVDKRIKDLTITKEPAKVISVESGYKRAVVEFLSGSRFALLNKSGEKLAPGDSVWVEYRTMPASGYISMRNGEADPIGGGGGLILHNGIIVTADQSGVYASSSTQTQVVNVKNLERTYYGTRGELIVAQQNMASVQKSTSTVTIDGWTYEDWSVYSTALSSTIVLGGSTYTFTLVSSTDYDSQNYSYVRYEVLKDGQAIPWYGTGYNYIATNVPLRNYGSPAFLPIYGTIYAPDQSYTYGSVDLTLYGGLMYGTNFEIASCEVSGISRVGFGSQAEYNYAVNLTKHTSLPPSLSVGGGS